MFGGTPPTIVDLVPSDIEIRDNPLYKPLTWMAGDPSYAGTPWSVKNIFELKNARRVLVEHNLLENNWVMGQNGFGVLFTVRTELDAAPWAVVEDVIFSNNVVRHTACGVNILGIDDSSASGSGRARTIEISNNLFADVGAPGLGGPGTLFQILNGAAGLTIDHNTALHTGSIIAADMAPSTGLVFQNNIVEHNEYGVFGSSKGIARLLFPRVRVPEERAHRHPVPPAVSGRQHLPALRGRGPLRRLRRGRLPAQRLQPASQSRRRRDRPGRRFLPPARSEGRAGSGAVVGPAARRPCVTVWPARGCGSRGWRNG